MAGKTLSLEFETIEEANGFRIRIANFKTRQDKQLVALGMIDTKDKQVFSFLVQAQLQVDPKDAPLIATLVFRDRSITRQYAVKIIKENDDET